jgi:hypothetical protein
MLDPRLSWECFETAGLHGLDGKGAGCLAVSGIMENFGAQPNADSARSLASP